MHCFDAILSFLIPLSCLICTCPLKIGYICTSCVPTDTLSKNLCPSCGQIQVLKTVDAICDYCQRVPSPIDEIRNLWSYDERASTLIKVMKYDRSLYIANWCANAALKIIPYFSKNDWDIIIPVPIDSGSLQKRGFNQCRVISSKISTEFKISHNESICLRSRRSPAQATLNSKERINNTRNLFKTNASLLGKKVLLIDDVITTGATVASIAVTLKHAGAARVDVLALARSQNWHMFRYRISKNFVI